MIPQFTYHLDPIASRSVFRSNVPCYCCLKNRGYLYGGESYSLDLDDEKFCPWCISNGQVYKRFDVSFIDGFVLSDDTFLIPEDAHEILPAEICKTICHYTPSFLSWQGANWWVHCHDAALFLGRAGPEFVEKFENKLTSGIAQDDQFNSQILLKYFQQFDENTGPTAYIFQCRHCQTYGGYWDCH